MQVVDVEEHSVQGERQLRHVLSVVYPNLPGPQDVVQVFNSRNFGEEQAVQSLLVPPLHSSQSPAHVLHVQSFGSPYFPVPHSVVQV